MKQVVLTMTVDGKPFHQQESLTACLQRVKMTVDRGSLVGNVTIKGWSMAV